MAKSNRTAKRTRLKYFFLNGQHHKVIRISRAEDVLVAWNYSENKKCSYVWSVAQKNMTKAFLIKDASKIFQRDKRVLHRYIYEGKIKRPAIAYPLVENATRAGTFLLSEDDMRELHAYLLTVHRGRPRKDGQITQSNLMSKSELEAIMREENILYTKNSDGEYVPVWKQPDW